VSHCWRRLQWIITVVKIVWLSLLVVAIDVGHLPPCGVTFKMLWPVFLFLFFLASCVGSFTGCCAGSFVGCCGGSTTVMLNLF